MTVGLSKTAILILSLAIFFRSFKDEADIIIKHYLAPRRLATDPIIRELE